MALIRGTVTGLRETKQSLRRMERRVAKHTLRGGAKLVAKDAKQRAPVRTGKLKRSIRPVGAKVKSKVEYSSNVHWGTRRRGKKDRQPFVIEAIDAQLGAIMTAYAERVQYELSREGRKDFERRKKYAQRGRR